jgi:hypothetical protein
LLLAEIHFLETAHRKHTCESFCLIPSLLSFFLSFFYYYNKVSNKMSNDTAMHASPEVKRAQKRANKSSSQRRTKRKVFDEGQTDEERRLLRVEQRNIHHVLATGAYRTRQRGQETQEEEEDRPTLEGVRDTNNELFQHVSYTRELVLDADNVVLLTNNYAKQVEQSVQVRMVSCIAIFRAA